MHIIQVILAVIVSWILCALLTATDAIPDDPLHWSYHARTDVKSSVLDEARWFRIPYPCKCDTTLFILFIYLI